MKKITLSFLFVFTASLLFAQYIRTADPGHKKYFISGGYGHGTARWLSTMGSSELYDKSGAVVKSGDIRFKAKNPLISYNFDVSFPVKKIRLGLGIVFEEHYLDKLVIESKNTPELAHLVFDESFRFDKFFALIEVPFWPESTSKASLGFNGHVGYFNYTGVKRLNFFGEEALAKTFFATVGIIGDLRLMPHTYVFLYPNFEFKYFRNSPVEKPSEIHHNIFTGSVVIGLRIDISKE